jgi:ADP-glucose pyrophosphorylase
MKQFVRALPQEGPCFKYLSMKFPSITQDKLKAGIFVGPQSHKLMKDKDFEKTMNAREKEAWATFRSVTENFLGNNKDPNYKNTVETMLENFKKLGCNMSVKVHFLHSHIEYFPENLGCFSEKQGERFHQDIKEMEKTYQGRWNEHMMAEYCWMLKRDCKDEGCARKSKKRKFEN